MGDLCGNLRCLRSGGFGCCETDGVCGTADSAPTEALLGPSTVLIGGDGGFDREKRDR